MRDHPIFCCEIRSVYHEYDDAKYRGANQVCLRYRGYYE